MNTTYIQPYVDQSNDLNVDQTNMDQNLDPNEDDIILPSHGALTTFSDRLRQIQVNADAEFAIYQNEISALERDIKTISVTEMGLVKYHMSVGQHLSNLKVWFKKNFRTTRGWVNFVLQNADYSVRTAQRDMELWRRLGNYQDMLSSPGNSRLALASLYYMSNENEVSDSALQFSLNFIQQNFLKAETIKRLTENDIRRAVQTIEAIEKDIPPEKQEIITHIAMVHQMNNPDLVPYLARLDDESLKEVQLTGNIDYTVKVDGIETTRSIPLDRASETDLLMMTGEMDDERQKRYLQHRVDNAKEREKRERGIISEKTRIVDAVGLSTDQSTRLKEFLDQNPDIRDIWGDLLNATEQSQGEAGVRSILYRLDYANDEDVILN